MTIEIKVPDLQKQMADRVLAYERAFARALELESTRIIQRTQGGEDAEGKRFRPYSEKYRQAKEFATGRGSTPDLVGFNYKRKDGKPSRRRSAKGQPGSMLASIRSKVARVGAQVVGTIFFSSPDQAAKARGNQVLRNFFNLSREQINKIIRSIKNG